MTISTTPTNKFDKIEAFKNLTPEGQSPKIYFDLVKNQVMGTDKAGNPRPDEDLLYFMYVAKRSQLDPLTRQIYAIYRWNAREGREKMTIQVSIDGMRIAAQRTGEYGGQDDIVFEDSPTAGFPAKATCTVYRINKINGQRMPTTASARWNEYAQTDMNGKPTMMWQKMPYVMLGKCAEALALRKTFPNELSGLYTGEEMSQADKAGTDLISTPKADSTIIAHAETAKEQPDTLTPAEQPKEAQPVVKSETLQEKLDRVKSHKE